MTWPGRLRLSTPATQSFHPCGPTGLPAWLCTLSRLQDQGFRDPPTQKECRHSEGHDPKSAAQTETEIKQSAPLRRMGVNLEYIFHTAFISQLSQGLVFHIIQGYTLSSISSKKWFYATKPISVFMLKLFLTNLAATTTVQLSDLCVHWILAMQTPY